jgi:hypothetical protein
MLERKWNSSSRDSAEGVAQEKGPLPQVGTGATKAVDEMYASEEKEADQELIALSMYRDFK